MLAGSSRRELISQANRLKSLLTVGGDDPDEDVIAHVRAAFERHPLLKIRVATSDRSACEKVAAELARKVPCEFLQRIGRVVLLYRQPAGSETA